MASSSLSSTHKMAGQNGKAYGTSAQMSNASKILEKKNANIHHIRQSTPDSEVLASSDDDHDQNVMSHSIHSTQSTQSNTFAKPGRRSSWLSEVQAGSQQRKFSLGSASNLQPSSQPATPSAETGPSPWNTGPPVVRFTPWSGTWQKDPPARLLENARMEGFGNRSAHDDEALISPTSQQFGYDEHDGSFPFPIPMQPVRKTIRSQSYSVGQMEAEANSAEGATAASNPSAVPGYTNRGVTGLRHRPSRPSTLGDSAGGRPMLGQLLEDEDDLPQSPVNYVAPQLPRTPLAKADQGSNITNTSSALLKQAALENARAKQRTSNNSAFTGSSDLFSRFNYSQQSNAAMTSDSGIEYNEYSNEEQGLGDPRRGDGKKALWQTSPGFFGSVDEGSQSRRHSFAEIPSRSRAVSSSLLSPRSHEGLATPGSSQQDSAVVDDPLYFSGVVPDLRTRQIAAEDQANALRDASASTPGVQNTFNPQSYANPFAVPNVITNPQPELYLVSFKCARADVYYIPAGTGLEVNVGDMVIVEGDRGIDLGTVSHAGVTMAEAKQLKEAATDQHFKWLMMFSRTMQSVHGTTASNGLLASSNGERPSAVGGMGPRVPLPQSMHGHGHGHSDSGNDQIRPKMIKRLAQNHEIQMLREKEGSEAKAKRVCQAKVADHGLNMEILDAEFQFALNSDWKKLTYFYYAESYVNFNELVTDLFKVYKTRIWMSAINPASFGGSSIVANPMLPSVGRMHQQYMSQAGPRNNVPVTAGPSRQMRPESRERDFRDTSFVPYNHVSTPFYSSGLPAPMPPPSNAWVQNITAPSPLEGDYAHPGMNPPFPGFFGYRWPPPPTAGPSVPRSYESAAATVRPEDLTGHFQDMSLHSPQH